MWENPEPGLAEFRTNGWKLVLASGERGVRRGTARDEVRMLVCRDDLVASSTRFVLPGISLPDRVESFIRGDALHVNLANSQDHPIGIELVLTAIEADEQRLVVESQISLNTSLLESQPEVDLEVGSGHPGHPRWGSVDWKVLSSEPTAIWLHAADDLTSLGPSIATSLLCDGCDRRSLKTESIHDSGRVRFFGEFLEKGVIRRVRPWWVWSNGMISRKVADGISAQLLNRPLPLSS